jgi:hypothetical protein
MRYLVVALLVLFAICGCDVQPAPPPISDSGVKKATVTVAVGKDGLTNEQRNVAHRTDRENRVSSEDKLSHFYVFTSNGEALLHSTVKGKVTSSGKRLTPTSVTSGYAGENYYGGIPIVIAGQELRTTEVTQDDGTYGSSSPYIYWWDRFGHYQQHFLGGGENPHISEVRLPVKVKIELDVPPDE